MIVVTGILLAVIHAKPFDDDGSHEARRRRAVNFIRQLQDVDQEISITSGRNRNDLQATVQDILRETGHSRSRLMMAVNAQAMAVDAAMNGSEEHILSVYALTEYL